MLNDMAVKRAPVDCLGDNALVERAQVAVSLLARSFQHLMREQLACGPVTVQQCYALAALAAGPCSMNRLAAEVGLHQSTLTRIVEKLEEQRLVRRERAGDDLRAVRVSLTKRGARTHHALDAVGKRIVVALLANVPAQERRPVVSALETVARLLDPRDTALRALLQGCGTAAARDMGGGS